MAKHIMWALMFIACVLLAGAAGCFALFLYARGDGNAFGWLLVSLLICGGALGASRQF